MVFLQFFPFHSHGHDDNLIPNNNIEFLDKTELDQLNSLNAIEKVDFLNELSEKYSRNNPQKAIKISHLAFIEAKKIDYIKGIAIANQQLGSLFEDQGNYNLAIDYYIQSLEIFKKIKDTIKITECLNNMGSLHFDQKNYDRALLYYKEAFNLQNKRKPNRALAISYMRLANVYAKTQKYQIASENYDTALQMFIHLKDTQGLASCQNNIGEFYRFQKKYDLAKDFYEQSLNNFIKIKNYRGTAENYNNLGELYYEQANYPLALKYFEKSLSLSKKILSQERILRNYEGLARTYAAMQNFKLAYDYHVKYKSLSDSIFTREISIKLTEQQLNSDFEKKLQEIDLIQKQEKYKTQYELKKQVWLRNTFIIGFVLLVILLGINIKNYRQKQKASKLLEFQFNRIQQQNEEIINQAHLLEESNKMLEKLSIVARETDNAIMIMEPDGTFEWVNDSLCRIYEQTLDEVRKNRGNNLISTSTNPNIKQIFKTCVKTKKPVTYESFFVKPNKNTIWFQTTLTPVLDENGNIKKLVAIETDITKIKEFEKEILDKNEELEQQKLEISYQRDQMLQQKKNITDSIQYAYRIQHAILPPKSYISQLFPEHLIFFKPKDIVSGDFYWFSEKKDEIIFGVIDCTGHGVPGAFMSLLGYNMLKQIIVEYGITKPSEVLNTLNKELIETLSRSGDPHSLKDGLDIALCTINKKTLELQFAGSHNPLYHFRNGKLTELKADIHFIGTPLNADFNSFNNQVLQLETNDSLYIFSDGFSDQFSAKTGRKFLTRQFKEVLQANCNKPFAEQEKILEAIFQEWKGCVEQTDDVLIVGVKI